MTKPGVDHRIVGVLGVLTICAYGCWYYAFGVLLDEIIADTGWGESMLTASFSTGTVLIGVASLGGGRLLDRAGHRTVFLLGAAVSAAGLSTASWADHPAVFFAGAAIGLGACGTLGFYHVTMPTAVRLNADGPRAIAVLTIWGALASAIFLPGTAWLLDHLSWRATARILALAGSGSFVLAAVAVPARPAGLNESVDATDSPRPITPLRQIVAVTFERRETRLFTAAIAFGGIAMATMLVYQVPAMTSLGMGAATASTIAALRGFCQLLGRLPLTAIVDRLGLDHALVLALGAVTVSGGLLAVASTVPVGVAFAVVAGFGIGAFSPLQGMKTESLFVRDDLGATMGLYGAVMVLAGSVGPLLAGMLAEATGDRRWAAAIVIAAAAASLACFGALAATTPVVDRPSTPK